VPGTEAARQRDEIRTRQRRPNPQQAELDEATTPYFEVDEQLQAFQRENVGQLVVEAMGDVHCEEPRELFERLRAWASEQYGAGVDRARERIARTPGLDGQDLTWDPRPEQWLRAAKDALDGLEHRPLIEPGLTQMGQWKADQHG
jgi:hypothetical protein